MPKPRAPWWMYVVAASFLAYFALLTYSDFWGPERVGMNIGFGGAEVVVQAVSSDSPGERAGLKPGDRLLAVDGMVIHSRFDWDVVGANLEVGRPHRMEIERDGQARELVVTLGYFAMIALPLNAFEIEMSAEQKGLRKPFAPLVVGKPGLNRVGERAGLPPISPRRHDLRDSPPHRRRGTLSAPRVPLLSGHDDVTPQHQHFLDRIVRTRGWIAPAFQLLLHSPDAAERMSNVGAFILYDAVVPPAIRALIGLIAARELDSDYVWAACLGSARAAKVDDRLIEAVERGKSPANLAAKEQALFDFCYQLLRGNHHVSDTAYGAAIAQFGMPATVQIAVTLGYFAMMGFVVNAFEVPAAGDDSRPAL